MSPHRCVKGTDYDAYGESGCGKNWARKQRNRARRAHRDWESIQIDLAPKRSRTVDRDAIQCCREILPVGYLKQGLYRVTSQVDY